MYVMLTTRCNFRCGHCCFACTNRGRDMSMATFESAMQLVEAYGQYVTLGGGEPTLHPKFLTMLGLALVSSDEGVHVVTNGSQTRLALRLADLARRGVLSAELSRSLWHLEQPDIDDRVVQAFTVKRSLGYEDRRLADQRGIRVTTDAVKAGRSKRGRPDCCCDDLLVDVDGVLWQCGCREVSLGTVDQPAIPDDWGSGCSRDRAAEAERERLSQLAEAAAAEMTT